MTLAQLRNRNQGNADKIEKNAVLFAVSQRWMAAYPQQDGPSHAALSINIRKGSQEVRNFVDMTSLSTSPFHSRVVSFVAREEAVRN